MARTVWEYLLLEYQETQVDGKVVESYWTSTSSSPPQQHEPRDLISLLDQLGAEGWELVAQVVRTTKTLGATKVQYVSWDELTLSTLTHFTFKRAWVA